MTSPVGDMGGSGIRHSRGPGDSLRRPCSGRGLMLEPGMQLLYREEVASILKGESPMSCHHSLPPAAKVPPGGASQQGRSRRGVSGRAGVSSAPLVSEALPESCGTPGPGCRGRRATYRESQPKGHKVTPVATPSARAPWPRQGILPEGGR